MDDAIRSKSYAVRGGMISVATGKIFIAKLTR
jgi:hypothetical protein